MFAYNSLIIEYDLKAKKLLRYYLPDRGGVKKGKLADPPSTIWFEKGYALNYLSDGAGGLAFRTRTDMQFFNY